jgi:SAM-dependent methyltransferase
MSNAEFDRFAADYRKIHQANISLSGELPEYFAYYKMRDLRWHVERLSLPEDGDFLDFGCGPGTSIEPFFSELPKARLTCADVSKASLEQARLQHGDRVTYELLGSVGSTKPREHRFVGAFANCVFHHIPHDAHRASLHALRDRLAPGGLLMIYEHNPLNPLTVHAVRTCPLDDNAVLIRAKVWPELLEGVGFKDVRVDFRVFFPASLAPLRRLESLLRWLPLGAQYCVTARAA